MSQSEQSAAPEQPGMFAPLKEPVFRRIWTASLLSNFGQLILGVGAAWEMTRQTNDPGMVALVQTAMMLPLMLVAAPAGAIADMFDKRKIAMAGLAISAICGAVLTALAWMGLATPWVLLGFCVLIGAGVSIYSPAWQSSIGEQVGPAQLPAAIALGTISYNVARSFGPALGGAIVLLAGAQAAFAINAVFYLPLLFAFLLWRRKHVPSRLPPERIDRAIVSGARFVFHSAMIRKVLWRAFLFGMVGATGSALAPLIAKDILGGNAATYGLLLGSSGAGAVAGAMFVSKLHHGLGIEKATRVLMLVAGIALIIVGVSRSLILTCLAMFVSGGANILSIALFNVAVQVGAPRWVTARALSLFSAALTGGIAIGAVIGGLIASATSVEFAVIISGIGLALIPLLMIAFPLPKQDQAAAEMADLHADPEVRLDITLRSGPIVIAIEYHVEERDARAFYSAMLKLQRVRLRNGGFNWSLSRDIADAKVWTERYQFPTWGDYLRTRDRYTTADLAVQVDVDAYLIEGERKSVRRMLERPFGSVRRHQDTPDTQQDSVSYLGP
ncbi:MFS transporter [Novosphingobium sp. AAP83]|nr:MFS transporter [Novosphingobium sp. AAP83]KPF91799.1 MFS transporter [Novosphingobium sp. AAP83]